MKVAAVLERMIAFSEGNLHDINHLVKVWGYARTLGQLEGLAPETQETLELAAIVHDIACPLCRKKYGSAPGRQQEEEGGPLAREFLSGLGLEARLVERVSWLVAHHHSYAGVDGMDYQLLLEADFLVNADEEGVSEDTVRSWLARVFKSAAGIRLLKSMYLQEEP